MRWLLLKDLQILRRSPLLTALLVIYPIVLAVLIGFAISRGPEKPSVAFLNRDPLRRGAGDRRRAASTRRTPSRALRPGRLRQGIEPRRGPEQGARRRGAGGADRPRGLHRQAPGAAERHGARVRGRRGLRQRGRPGQGAACRRPDQRAAHRGEPDPLRSDLRGAPPLPRRPDRGRRVQRAGAGPDDPGARAAERREHPAGRSRPSSRRGRSARRSTR